MGHAWPPMCSISPGEGRSGAGLGDPPARPRVDDEPRARGAPFGCCLGGWMAGHRWEELLPTGRDVSQRRSAQRNPEITSRGRARMLQLTCPRWRGSREHGGVPGTDLRGSRRVPCACRRRRQPTAGASAARTPRLDAAVLSNGPPEAFASAWCDASRWGNGPRGRTPRSRRSPPGLRPPSDVRAARARSAGPPLSADNDQIPEPRGRRLGMEPQRVSWHHSWC